MPRTVWTKLSSDPNDTWSRHEGEPPFSVPATARLSYDIYTDTGESFVITPLDAVAPPVLSGAPAVAGTYAVGQTLTATAAASTGTAPITTTWQWLRDGTDIPGATEVTYLIAAVDEGTQVSVRQTNTNAHGSDSAVSAAQTVTAPPAGVAVISGLMVSDQDGNGEMSLTYDITADSALTAVLTTSPNTPAAARVLAGEDHAGAAASDSFVDTWTTAGSDTLPPLGDGLVAGTYYLHVLPAGGGDADVESSNGFTLETVLPSITAAVTDTDGDLLTLTVSEAVSGTGVPADWTINGVSAGAPTIDSVVIAGTTITIGISGNLVGNGDTVTLDYTPGDIEDTVANLMAAFTGQAVTNNVASYTDTLVSTNTGTAYLQAPAGGFAPANTDQLAFFFSGIGNNLGREMLFSVDGSSDGLWAGYSAAANLGLRFRIYSDNQNMQREVSEVPAGERYAVFMNYWLDNSGGNVSKSEVRIWRLTTGWQTVVSDDEGDNGTYFPEWITPTDRPELFRDQGGGNEFDGSIARMALWTGTQGLATDAPIIDITTDETMLDYLLDNLTGLTRNPADSQNANGFPNPVFDFNGVAARYNSGNHDGTLASFTKPGSSGDVG